MNQEEAFDLLEQIAAFDRRSPTAAEAKHWALALHDITLDQASAAHVEWVNMPPEQRPDEFVMPGDIRRIVKEKGNPELAEQKRNRLAKIGDPYPDMPESVPNPPKDRPRQLTQTQVDRLLHGVIEARAALPHHTPIDQTAWQTELDRTKSVACPWCKAQPYERCTNRASGNPLTHRPAHPARVTAAERNAHA